MINTGVDTFVRLIQDLRIGSQDDDIDPSNIAIQQFQAPEDKMSSSETFTLTWERTKPIWIGKPTFQNTYFYWCSGGYYQPSMEVFSCLMLM